MPNSCPAQQCLPLSNGPNRSSKCAPGPVSHDLRHALLICHSCLPATRAACACSPAGTPNITLDAAPNAQLSYAFSPGSGLAVTAGQYK